MRRVLLLLILALGAAGRAAEPPSRAEPEAAEPEGPTVDTLVARAQLCAVKQDWSQAEAVYHDALDKDRDRADAWRGLGYVLRKQDKIAEVTVSDQRITGKLKAPSNGKSIAVANLVPPEIAERLDKYGVKYTRVQENTFFRDLLSWVVPALVFFGIWFLLVRRMAGQQGLGGGQHPRVDVAVQQRGVVVQEIESGLAVGVGDAAALPGLQIDRVGRIVDGGAGVAARQHLAGALEEGGGA